MHSTRVWHLLGRKLTGDATLDELQELEQYLLEHPELASSVEMQITYFEAAQATADEQVVKRAWDSQLDRMQKEFPEDFLESEHLAEKKEKSRNPIIRWMIAATILLGGLIAVSTFWQTKGKAISSTEQGGKKKKLTLPDGTLVWLNKNSRIGYNADFGTTNRDVELSGEAFFDVAHNENLPMTIHAGPVDIRVKGTAFNVLAYPEAHRVETSLIRGEIELSLKRKPQQKVVMKPNEKIVVSYEAATSEKEAAKNMSVKLERNLLEAELQSGLIPEVAWIEDKLVFSNESFAIVAEKMSRWYDVKITIKDPGLEEEQFTGAFEKESLQQALHALQMTYDFKYKKNADGNISIYK